MEKRKLLLLTMTNIATMILSVVLAFLLIGSNSCSSSTNHTKSVMTASSNPFGKQFYIEGRSSVIVIVCDNVNKTVIGMPSSLMSFCFLFYSATITAAATNTFIFIFIFVCKYVQLINSAFFSSNLVVLHYFLFFFLSFMLKLFVPFLS